MLLNKKIVKKIKKKNIGEKKFCLKIAKHCSASRCEVNEVCNICFLKANIKLNKSHPYFQVHNSEPAAEKMHIVFVGYFRSLIVRPNIDGLTMHTFTNDTCLSFSSLIEITEVGLGLEVIQENAFEKCVNLKRLDFSFNNLTFINVGTFKNNDKLKELDFSKNKLKMFDFKLLNGLKNLETLNLKENQLEDFSVKESEVIENLISLYLESNNFTDLDVDEVFQKFPALRVISLKSCTLIPDERFKEIVDQFKSKNIYIEHK